MKILARTILLTAFLGLGFAPAGFAGNDPSYCHDEAMNPRGPNQCSSDAQCDGARTCSGAGWCQGTNRAPTHTAKCTSTGGGIWMPQTDLTGNLLGNSGARTLTECEGECNANSNCAGWTWDGGGACHLKSSVTGSYNKPNNVSGTK